MENHYRIAKTLTNLLENKFRIGGIRFGFDPIIGAIPFGDVITTVLSLYIVWIGMQMRIPQEKIVEMVGNVAIDFLVGLFPVIGDFSDVVIRSNSKNMQIIDEFRSKVVEGQIVP